mgnify:CR=1 FL=1
MWMDMHTYVNVTPSNPNDLTVSINIFSLFYFFKIIIRRIEFHIQQFMYTVCIISFLFFCANKYVDYVRWSLLRIVNTGVESGRSGEQRGHWSTGWSRGGVCHNIVKCLLYNKQAWWCTGSSSGQSMWIIIYSHNYISVSIQSIIKENPLSSLDFSRLDILRSEPDCAFSYYNAVFKLFIICWEWPVLIRNVDGDPEVDRIAVTQGV